jgi:hypothetical protein
MAMKRLLVVLMVFFVPGVALAFDANRHAPSSAMRIAILREDADTSPNERMVHEKVVRYLTNELKSHGLDAYETEWTYDDAADVENVDVDYYVDVISAGADTDAAGGVEIGGRDGEVTIGVIVSHVAAELRVYDAHTMELVASETIRKRNSAIRPTSIGVGGSDIFAWIAIPFFERAQFRSAAKAAAKEAAGIVVDAVR